MPLHVFGVPWIESIYINQRYVFTVVPVSGNDAEVRIEQELWA